jgi:hypothetical protein
MRMARHSSSVLQFDQALSARFSGTLGKVLSRNIRFPGSAGFVVVLRNCQNFRTSLTLPLPWGRKPLTLNPLLTADFITMARMDTGMSVFVTGRPQVEPVHSMENSRFVHQSAV